MKYAKYKYGALAGSLLTVAAGCDTAPPLPKPAKGYYSKETLGELPIAPQAQKAPDVISLVQPAGETPVYRTKVATTLSAGTMTCELKAGELIHAIGDADTRFLAQVDKTSLSKPCENSGDADFVEGYIEKKDLDFVSMPSPLPQASNQGVEQVSTPTAQQQTETTSMSPNKCEKVKYGSKVKSGKTAALVQFAQTFGGKNRIPGALWRKGGEEFFLKVEGQADAWKVQAFNTSKNKKMDAKVMNSGALEKMDGGVIIPFEKFVEDPNEWRGANIEIIITPQTRAGVEGSETCKQKINLMSPLVLDFSGRPFIRTQALTQSGVEFDLDADGQSEQTGWIDGSSAAFLVLDINGNGRIDNGSEMFGEATRIAGAKKNAPEGFAALTQYDLNGDHKIDARDAIYGKLQLWFDRNGNGVTDAGELVSLAKKQVSFISLKSVAQPRSQALQHLESIPNDVRTSASFEAAGCPASGCRVYDIYFGTAHSLTISQK
ncbi:MAG: hypothetical protein RIR26_1105 [Pseudomonadota bacterium]